MILLLVASNTEMGAADDVLRAQAATITSGIEIASGQVRFGGGDLPAETQGGVAVDAAVVSGSGVLTKTPSQPLQAADLTRIVTAAQAARGAVLFDVTDVHGVPRRVFAEPLAVGVSGPAPILVVSRSIAEVRASITALTILLGILGVLVIVTGSLLAYRLAGRVLEPVRRISVMARSISEHDLHRRVDLVVPQDELGQLVATFNDMLARLEDSFESLRRFTADASHELRTPLALMRTELEGALARRRDPAENRRVLLEIQQEVERMSRLVDRLLMLARADAGSLQPAAAPLDVADTLYEAAARWRPEADRKRVSLEVGAPDTGLVEADADLIRRVLDNLIDNAIRHSPDGGSVNLDGEREPGGWRVDVSDSGPGVAADAREILFRRFARPDGARARDGGGAGLGLALSRAIAEAHGGTLELVDSGGTGAVFRLHLPDRPLEAV